MKTTVKRLVYKPAVCSFDVIQNLTDSDIKEKGYPENIRKWGWTSIVELQEAMNANFRNHYEERGNMPPFPTLKPKDFMLLNMFENLFSWFVMTGNGNLQTERSPEACPFDDELLYVPTKWAERVITQASRGYIRIQVLDEENRKGLYGYTMDSVEGKAVLIAL